MFIPNSITMKLFKKKEEETLGDKVYSEEEMDKIIDSYEEQFYQNFNLSRLFDDDEQQSSLAKLIPVIGLVLQVILLIVVFART